MNPWFLAARPKTLVAGLVPVVLGSAVAFQQGSFKLGVFVCALFGALAIQVGTNYVNDASDFERGADTPERLGPARMAASGLITPRALYIGAGACFLLASLFGAYLISVSGIEILAIGLCSILFAIAYTAGPFPLAYLGLGDIFVLLLFGFVAVLGTVFAHASQISSLALWVALATGLHAMGLIAVNNLRDIPTDTLAGKKTLSLRMGDSASRFYFGALELGAFVCWIPIGSTLLGWQAWLPLLSLPLALANAKRALQIEDRREFNVLLAKAAALQLLFGFLATLSLVFSR